MNCHSYEWPLDVDHIYGRGRRPDLIFDLLNLQILCRSCHDKKGTETHDHRPEGFREYVKKNQHKQA